MEDRQWYVVFRKGANHPSNVVHREPFRGRTSQQVMVHLMQAYPPSGFSYQYVSFSQPTDRPDSALWGWGDDLEVMGLIPPRDLKP